MSYDVINAEYAGGFSIRVTFENGKSGTVDFKPYIDRGGVFRKLSDIGFFKRFSIDPELKVISWNREIDIAPETLYHEATGEPLPEWMTAVG
jgi:hypothetical protein